MTNASSTSLIEKAMARGRADTPARHVPAAPLKAPIRNDLPTFDLDRRRLVRNGLLAANDRGRQADQIAAIERSLLRRLDLLLTAPGARRRHRVLVTSPRDGDGKSFIAWNLALDLAIKEGIGILLIDADLRSSGWGRVLGDKATCGLADLLADRASLDSCLYRVRDLPITILHGGDRKGPAGMALNVNKFAEILKKLSVMYSNDLILVDGPPVLSGVDTNVIASQVDETVLVVAAGKSLPDEVALAIDLMPDPDKLSLILNGS